MAPISTFAAMIIGRFDQIGISLNNPVESTFVSADPFFVLLESIPFMFYSILTLACVWFVVYKRISFGPMRTQEMIAQTTGNLFGGKEMATVACDLQTKSGSARAYHRQS